MKKSKNNKQPWWWSNQIKYYNECISLKYFLIVSFFKKKVWKYLRIMIKLSLIKGAEDCLHLKKKTKDSSKVNMKLKKDSCLKINKLKIKLKWILRRMNKKYHVKITKFCIFLIQLSQYFLFSSKEKLLKKKFLVEALLFSIRLPVRHKWKMYLFKLW